MKFRYITVVALFATVFAVTGLTAKPAQAQYFTNHDGYTDSGGYRVQVELDTYLWWPGLTGSVHFASPLVNSRTSGDFNTGLFSLQDILHTLHFAFMGSGIVRYGPYSAELDLQYLSVSQSQTLFASAQGGEVRVKSALQLLRVAPGIGYQVYAGNVYGIPTSADARAGFAYTTTWQSYTGEGVLAGRSSSSNPDFIQPWLGGRVDFIPAPRWRIEIERAGAGFRRRWRLLGLGCYGRRLLCDQRMGLREPGRPGAENSAVWTRPYRFRAAAIDLPHHLRAACRHRHPVPPAIAATTAGPNAGCGPGPGAGQDLSHLL